MTTGRMERVLCHSCKRLICRMYLEGGSAVEIKCGSCNAMNLLTTTPIEAVLVPDGVGGYLTSGAISPTI